MSSEPSPRPWQVIKMIGIDEDDVSVFVADAHNSAIARLVAYAENDDANAALIVDAVNERAKFEEARMKFPDFRPVIIAAGQRDAAIAERDRLRDIVRRLADSLQGIMDAAEGRGEGVLDEALLREARAAIGEDAHE